MPPLFSALQASCLTIHILYSDVKDLAQAGAVFQHLPGLIGVVMDFNELLISNHQQTVAHKTLQKGVVDAILVQVMAFDQKLGIIAILDHLVSSPLSGLIALVAQKQGTRRKASSPELL